MSAKGRLVSQINGIILCGRGCSGRASGRRARWGFESMKLPNQIGPIHFVGIGGIGMSGIAEAEAAIDRSIL